MKILVTGAKGQLGRCIQDLAKDYIKHEFFFTDYLELDISQPNQVNDIFTHKKFDYCINCAAYTAVDKAENEPDLTFEINAQGPKNLAEACLNFGCTLIHISTDFVFDGRKPGQYTEMDVPNPINIYGKSKLKGEQYIQGILNNYFVIRTSWVYSQYGHNFLKTMLRIAREKEEISVVNDQLGSPTYARDLAEFVMLIINKKSKNYGLYNYTNEGIISWYDFSVEIFKQLNLEIVVKPIKSNNFPVQAKRPDNSKLNTTYTRKAFQIEIPFWTHSLRKCLNYKEFVS
jgi:dTDP-4-dehydrorhamnose reductase